MVGELRGGSIPVLLTSNMGINRKWGIDHESVRPARCGASSARAALSADRASA